MTPRVKCDNSNASSKDQVLVDVNHLRPFMQNLTKISRKFCIRLHFRLENGCAALKVQSPRVEPSRLSISRRQVYQYIASTKKFCKCLFLFRIEVLRPKCQTYSRNGFTPAFSVVNVHRRHLGSSFDMPSFDITIIASFFTFIYNRSSNINLFIYTSHPVTPHGRNELNKLTSLPTCGFIAQLVEHRTGIAEVTGSNPVGALF